MSIKMLVGRVDGAAGAGGYRVACQLAQSSQSLSLVHPSMPQLTDGAGLDSAAISQRHRLKPGILPGIVTMIPPDRPPY